MIPSLADYRRRIVELRQKSGLTQEEAADASDVSQSFVTKLERGDTTPRYDRAARLYNTLEQHVRGDTETAADLAHPDLIAAHPEDTVEQTAARMKQHGVSQLPVIDNDRCIGSVTSRGLLDANDAATIRDHMAPPFPEVGPATPRTALIELLKTERATLVRNEDGITGIITSADII